MYRHLSKVLNNETKLRHNKIKCQSKDNQIEEYRTQFHPNNASSNLSGCKGQWNNGPFSVKDTTIGTNWNECPPQSSKHIIGLVVNDNSRVAFRRMGGKAVPRRGLHVKRTLSTRREKNCVDWKQAQKLSSPSWGRR